MNKKLKEEELKRREEDIKRREDELAEKERKRRQQENDNWNRSLCEIYGHEYTRMNYIGVGDTNYLVCQRCGHETTD